MDSHYRLLRISGHTFGRPEEARWVDQEGLKPSKKAKPAPQPRTARVLDPELVPWPKLDRLFRVTQDEIDMDFAHMDWHEPSVQYLRRNAPVAVGNSGEKGFLPFAESFSNSDNALLNEHAAWASARLDML